MTTVALLKGRGTGTLQAGLQRRCNILWEGGETGEVEVRRERGKRGEGGRKEGRRDGREKGKRGGRRRGRGRDGREVERRRDEGEREEEGGTKDGRRRRERRRGAGEKEEVMIDPRRIYQSHTIIVTRGPIMLWLLS